MASSLKFALTALIAAGSLAVANQAEAGNRGLGLGIGIGLGVIALGAIAAGSAKRSAPRERSYSRGSSHSKAKEQAQSSSRARAQAEAKAEAAARARQQAKAEAAASARQQAKAEASSRARARAVAEAKADAKAEAAREARLAAARREKANDRNEPKVERAVIRKPADETPATDTPAVKTEDANNADAKSTYVAPPSTAALLNRVDSEQASGTPAADLNATDDNAPLVTGSVSDTSSSPSDVVASTATATDVAPQSDTKAGNTPVDIKPSQGGDCKKFIPSIGVTVSVGC